MKFNKLSASFVFIDVCVYTCFLIIHLITACFFSKVSEYSLVVLGTLSYNKILKVFQVHELVRGASTVR